MEEGFEIDTQNEEAEFGGDLEIDSASPSPDRPKGRNRWIVLAVVAVAVIILIATLWAIDPTGGGLLDSDGDGIADSKDAFPDDPDETMDSDGDGVGDNTDAFPNDENESVDSDGDGHGDYSDVFPDDPTEWCDSDNDGVGNNMDAFPYDPTETTDSDSDGHGDNSDMFPHDASEWKDTDNDGTGDNADICDQGNGNLKISISYYDGDGSADFWTDGDPYFVIKLDVNDDGTFDHTRTSQVYVDRETIDSPYSQVFDVAEDITTIRFQIIVYDDDEPGYEVIDYCPGSGGTSYIHTVSAPFSDSWDYNGRADYREGEADCTLRYSISVTH